MSIAMDGASAMIGRHKDFIAYLKNKVPGVLAVHYPSSAFSCEKPKRTPEYITAVCHKSS